MSPWRPLFDRLKREHSDDVLHEGIPAHMESSLHRWLQEAIFEVDYLGMAQPHPSVDKLQDIERTCRVPLDWKGPTAAWESLFNEMMRDHQLALEVVNRVLSWAGENPNQRQREHILQAVPIFVESGSAWGVGVKADGSVGLQRRVGEEVAERFDAVAASQTRAGEHLQVAWDELYGLEPDPTEAYEHAVKAVEAAARPVLAPDDDRATLTKMTGNLRDASHKWVVEMASDAPHTTGVDALHAMMDALGKGQHTRHGTPDTSRPKDASPAEAEAAVHIAVTLVHWFHAGLVQRRATSD